jgi:hypothetical protein
VQPSSEILQTFVDKCEMTSVVTETIELPKSGYTVYGCYYNDPIKLIVCNNLCVCHVNSTISCRQHHLVSTTHYNFINTLDDAGLCQVLEILAVKEKQTLIS